MSRTGTSVYPATLDSFDRIGTTNYKDEVGYTHTNVHNEAMDGIENIESVIGTTAGTSVLKNVLVGQFVATTAGTETLTNKTLTSPVINTGFTGTGKATGAEINTGTEDAKIVTPKAIADSDVVLKDKTQTLTAKTLTNPTINFTDKAPSINVKAAAYLSAAQAIGTGTVVLVIYNTEKYDIGSDFNTSTGVFTAPVTGYYFVSHNVNIASLADAKRVISYIYVNGAAVMSAANTTGVATNVGACASGVFYVESGQTIDGRVYHDHGSDRNVVHSAGESQITIHLIST